MAPPGVHRVPVVSRDELGESRLWPVLAVLTAAGLYATLPTRFIAASSGAGFFGVARWVVPALTILLMGPLLLTAPQRPILGSTWISRRALSIAVIAVITAANAVAIILLVHFLVVGGQVNARELIRAGIHMWCMNALVFGLWFWELDGGGPVERRLNPAPTYDFLFPQQALESTAGRWRPSFVDYLYVAYTNATAFSPTDAMPLSTWAKGLMALESAASLLLAVMVVARAVNILK